MNAFPLFLSRALAGLVRRLVPARRRAAGLGWHWSVEVHRVLIDGAIDVVVPCRVLRRPGCRTHVIPLGRRRPRGLPAPSLN